MMLNKKTIYSATCKKYLMVFLLLSISCPTAIQTKLNLDIDFDKTDLQNKLEASQAKKNNNKKQTAIIKEEQAPVPVDPAPLPEPEAEPQKLVDEAAEQNDIIALEEQTKIEQEKPDEQPIVAPQTPSKKSKKSKKDPFIKFQFKEEPLVNIINKIAAKRGINIVLPQGADVIKTTITFEQKGKIRLSLAEKFMYQFLDLAGYMMHPNNGFFVIVKKSENTTTRVPLHLYINVPPKDLPESDEFIRAIYFLANFKVPESTQGNEPLNLILKDMLGTKKGYLFDPSSNAVILTGSANNIASVMTIILELDGSGSPETVEVFPLFNATATTIAKLLNEQIISTIKDKKPGSRGPTKGGTGLYFTPNTRIVPDPRTNSLIIIGTETAVNRIKDFVRDYMDQPLDSGRSILHVYDLQYLNSKEFAKVLQNILKKSKSGQSEKDNSGGPNRMFEDVVVVPEEEQAVESKTIGGAATQAKGKVTVGGNRLIIAAKHDDWVQIKALIEQLDKPQLQVIIEVMILDLSIDNNKLLQAQTRNPGMLNLHDNIEFQTAQMNPIVTNATTTMPKATSIAPDLLRLFGTDPSLAVTETQGDGLGSLIISFNDSCKDGTSGIWGLLKILDTWAETNIISHPFLVTKNNIKAKESLVNIRRGAGPNDTTGSVTTIKQEDFKATLSIEVTPRISSLDRLNLQLTIDVENFIDSTQTTFNKAVRSIETNANLGSGQILVLGGLARIEDASTEKKWPILGDFPIIGSWFRGTINRASKKNLVIFVHPTVVDPKLRAGQNKYTDDKIATEYRVLAEDNLFSASKDPVTRFFFRSSVNGGEDALTRYLDQAYYKQKPDDNSPYAVSADDTYIKPSEAAKLKNMLANEQNPLNKE